VRRRLDVTVERFPLAARFVIARGARTESVVVVATLDAGEHKGRGECVPYPRYGETVDSVIAQIESRRDGLEAGADRQALQGLLPPGAARNVLDCALWDLDAKRLGRPAHELAGAHRVPPATTAFTLSLGKPDDMAAAARAAAWRPLLKIKLGAAEDLACLAAVRDAAPEAELIVDANEGWDPADLEAKLAACAACGVALVEQPLPAGKDAGLAAVERPVPVCADESVHDRRGLEALRERYDAINIKLDKTGGLTEALALADAAQALGFGLMVGCMVSSSLSMAPAMLLTPRARFVDLDGPLLLAQDRPDGLRYEGSIVHPPSPALWG
jgi:L-alanine-DL-glutamate epimerase-like enolase superfamily enzyme